MKKANLMRLIADKRVVSGLIKSRGMTYRSLAAAAGTSAATISELANGRRVDTSEAVAMGFAKALQVEPEKLFHLVRTEIDIDPVAA